MASRVINSGKITNKKNSKYKICIIFLILIGCIACISISTIYKSNEVQEDNLIKESEKNIDSNDPVIQNLLEKAKNNTKVKMILKDVDSYPKELLELAAKKDELIDYVANYKKYDSSTSKHISIKNDYTEGTIPHFIQWDERWGYDKYGSEFMAINGCGPASLAMVAVGLTGNTDINPKVVADFSVKNGYVVNGRGSSWTLMSEGSKNFGLMPKELPLSENVIINTLKSGKPIIVSMGPGTFTSSGHYVVLTGVDKNNKIIINDSDSKVRSKQTWDIGVFMKETKNLWTFTVK